MITYFEGIIQIANVFLAVVAGFIAASMFKAARGRKELAAWKPLIIALILFAVEEVLGALVSFDIFKTPYLTHIVPSLIVGFLIWALVQQILISKENV